MTAAAELLDQIAPITEALTKVGIPVDPYKRGPVDTDTFVIALHRGAHPAFRIWPGAESVYLEVPDTDKKRRQAVLKTRESSGTVTRKTGRLGDWVLREGQTPTEHTMRSHFPITMPRGTTYKLISREDQHRKDDGIKSYLGTVLEIEARRPLVRQAFLIGYDENDLFISQLPKVVNTVADAHKALRPKGISDKAIRQGEWFFDPVSKTVSDELDRLMSIRPARVAMRILGSDHRAYQFCNWKNKEYACGLVVAPRHAPLELGGWHRVIRNSEVETTPMNNGSWD